MPTAEQQAIIRKLRDLPGKLEALVAGLRAADLTTAFQPGEWTVAQNVHHLADAQINFYIRAKLIVLEDHPTVKPWEQNPWAETPDSTGAELAPSLAMIRGTHERYAQLLASLTAAQWQRTAFHPQNGEIVLEGMSAYAADHGEAHLRQISATLAAKP